MKSVKRASFWVVAAFVAAIAIGLGGNLILTRILPPESFGMFAVVTAILFGLNMISDLGLKQSVIRSNRSNETVFLDTVWTVQILKGLVICIALILVGVFLFLFSDSLSGVYSDPQLSLLMFILAIQPLINGFEPTKVAIAQRNLDMGALSRVQIYAPALGFMLSVILAISGYQVWSLVYGAIVTSLARTVISYVLIPGPGNSIKFEKEAFSEIFNFGKWIFITSGVAFIAMNGDKLILASFLTPERMGIYSVAFLMYWTITQLARKFSLEIALSKLSETYRNDPSNISKSYYEFRFLSDLYLVFSAGFFFIASESIIAILYEGPFEEAGRILSLLSIGLFMERYMPLSSALMAIGQPKSIVGLTTYPPIILAIGLPLSFVYFGEDGSLYFLAFYKFLTLPIQIWVQRKFGLMDIKKELLYSLFIFVGLFFGWIFILLAEFIGGYFI